MVRPVRRDGRVVYGARLESVLGATPHGFESRSLRQLTSRNTSLRQATTGFFRCFRGLCGRGYSLARGPADPKAFSESPVSPKLLTTGISVNSSIYLRSLDSSECQSSRVPDFVRLPQGTGVEKSPGVRLLFHDAQRALGRFIRAAADSVSPATSRARHRIGAASPSSPASSEAPCRPHSKRPPSGPCISGGRARARRRSR